MPALPALIIVLMAVLSAGLGADLARAQSTTVDAPDENETAEVAAVFALPDGFVARNPDGGIVVEEFLDYYCTFCKVSSPEVDALAAADPDIRLVIRELPILTPQSLPLAQIALAASYQGLYLEVHKAMMTARSVPSPEAALAIVASLGGDPEQILADMNRPEIGLHIRRNLERALAVASGPRPVSSCRGCLLQAISGRSRWPSCSNCSSSRRTPAPTPETEPLYPLPSRFLRRVQAFSSSTSVISNRVTSTSPRSDIRNSGITTSASRECCM